MPEIKRVARLRAKRRSRSAAREQKQFWGEVSPSKADALSTAQLDHAIADLQRQGLNKALLRHLGNTTRFDARQRLRDFHHKKRNKRKDNVIENKLVTYKKPLGKEERERRRVLLTLQQRPKDMPVELYKGLARERKALLKEHPKSELRRVPNMSNRLAPRPFVAPKTRLQVAPELSVDALSPIGVKAALKAGMEIITRANGKKHSVVGYKAIYHVIPPNPQRHG